MNGIYTKRILCYHLCDSFTKWDNNYRLYWLEMPLNCVIYCFIYAKISINWIRSHSSTHLTVLKNLFWNSASHGTSCYVHSHCVLTRLGLRHSAMTEASMWLFAYYLLPSTTNTMLLQYVHTMVILLILTWWYQFPILTNWLTNRLLSDWLTFSVWAHGSLFYMFNV